MAAGDASHRSLAERVAEMDARRVQIGDVAGGKFPAKQQQNDEATAPCDDQERRAVEKRQQRKADEKRARMMAMHESGALSMRTDRDAGGGGAGGGVSGAYTPKGSWFSGRISLTGRRRGGGGGTSSGLSGFLSSRSNAQSTGRSMMSTIL